MNNYKVKRTIVVTLATLLMCLGFPYFGPFIKVYAVDDAGNTTPEILDISNEVTKLDMEFDKSIVKAGDNLVVTITANNVVDLKGFDLSILYNSEFFTLQDAFVHDNFGNEDESVYFDMVDEPGKVRLLGTLLGQEARSGNLRIVSLILKSKSNTDGKTPIIISSGSQTSDKDATLFTILNDIVKDAVIANPDVVGNDGFVRINDLTKVAGCFMQSYGQNGYNSACDMDKDGIIDLFDIVYVARIILHGVDDNAVELIHTYPFNMQNDYYPRYGYLTLDFSEDMRPCNDISKICIVSSDGIPVNRGC